MSAALTRARCLITLFAAGLLGACSGGGDDNRARIDLGVTDAPVDGASHVVIEFTGVELKPAGGNALQFDFDAPRQIDLLALTGTDSELLLDGTVIPPGQYEWIRLKVNTSQDTLDSYIEIDGTQHPLYVPSGQESGLKLNRGFTVAQGSTTRFTVDFNLRQSVHEPQNANSDAFILRPTLRIVDNLQVGTLAGTVATLAAAPGCTPAVYVYTGAGVTPDDIDGNPPEPLTSATVTPQTNGSFTYEIGFLETGSYTVSFTCNAAADDPDADDSATVQFAGTQDVTITADATATADFP